MKDNLVSRYDWYKLKLKNTVFYSHFPKEAKLIILSPFNSYHEVQEDASNWKKSFEKGNFRFAQLHLFPPIVINLIQC